MIRRQSQKDVARARRKRMIRLFVALVVLAALIVGALWATHTYPFHKKKLIIPVHTANSTTKGEPLGAGNQPGAGQSQNSNWPSDNKSPTDNAGGNPSSSNQKLEITSGNFVSNHRPHLNDTEQSSCVTSPGATCQIIFTAKDGTIKSLPAQKTDVGGGVYWNSWTPASIGLTADSWHVQAKAVMGAQTATSDDAISLEVSP